MNHADAQATAIPMLAVFGIAAFLLIRSREVNWWVGAVFFLFGILVGATPYVFTIVGLLNWFAARFF
jgi:hypothetical protein